MALTSSGSGATAHSGRAFSVVISTAGVDIRGERVQGGSGGAEKLFCRGGGTLVRMEYCKIVGKD